MISNKLKIIYYFILLSLFAANSAVALEINFTEHGKKRLLTQDAQNILKIILPKADSLNLRIERLNNKKTAVMTVLLDNKIEDGFMIMKEIPEINSYTYLVAWLLQGHFYFLKEQAMSARHKRHLKLLNRYFGGKIIYGDDTFYLGESVELFYEPKVPKVRGMNFTVSVSNPVLYSGSPTQNGFAKILVPGFNPKYIAILPQNKSCYAHIDQ